MIRSYRWLVVTFVILAAATCFGQLAISVQIGPPPLPVYRQPRCPDYGYIWTPGYWAWGDDGYYWVPGTWVLAPERGYLWTPGYWAFSDGFYRWNPGYWALEVGFYGDIDYGYGYPGNGYYGGRWRGDHFYYNRAVNNVNITNVHYVYNQRVVNHVTVQRVSYNGGPGGTAAKPTAAQMAAERGHHIVATSLQLRHEQEAKADRRQFASVNHGRPPVAATPKPAEFKAATVPATNKPTFHPTNKPASNAISHPPASRNKPEPTRATNNVPHPEKQSPARPSNGVNTPHAAPSPKTNARVATPPHAAPPPHETAPKEAAPAHEARPPQPKGEEKKPNK